MRSCILALGVLVACSVCAIGDEHISADRKLELQHPKQLQLNTDRPRASKRTPVRVRFTLDARLFR